MHELLSWIFYVLGGLIFTFGYTNSRKMQNKPKLVLGKVIFTDTIRPIMITEIVWIMFWCVGIAFNVSPIYLLCGAIPIGVSLLTWCSLAYVTIKQKIRTRRSLFLGEKKILPIINRWSEKLPNGDLVEDVLCYVTSENERLNGRVTIIVKSTMNSELDWDFLVKKLQEDLKQPLIIEVRSGNKKLYPNWGK